jgi:hypothetical protein
MTNIALENGAVHIRYWSDTNGSAMLANPPWFYDPNTKTYVIQFIQMNASTDLSQTGIGTVRMKLNGPTEQEDPINISGKTVTISYTGDPEENYITAWKNYFGTKDLNMTSPSVSWPTVSSTLGPADWLVIKRYNVTIISL